MIPDKATFVDEAGEADEALTSAEDEADEAMHSGDGAEADADQLAPSIVRAHRTIPDALYGALPISRWAQELLELAPFARLAGVSLSDAPGELLLHRPFPSRLTHSLGVYYLSRQARPRDRALHVAALAHDLGHGPFSHLSEPLMIERLGMNHEQRSVTLLRQALAGLRGTSARLLAWLDADEIAALILGGGPEGRGKLLNGLLDYDNLDNVARFLQAAELGVPGYDPRALARALRLVAPDVEAQGAEPSEPYVALAAEAETLAQAWLADRRRVYRYLGQGERNLAIHGMLRKAIDLAEQAGRIPEDFFDLTDGQALRLLESSPISGAAALVEAVTRDALYMPVWEALAPERADALTTLFSEGRARLTLEERVATEAGLRPDAVVFSYTIARGERALPPTIASITSIATERGRAEPAPSRPSAQDILRPILSPPERSIVLLVARTAGRDYVRRARMAAERALDAFGAIPQEWAHLP